MKKKIFITSVMVTLVAVSFVGYFVGCGQTEAPSKIAPAERPAQDRPGPAEGVAFAPPEPAAEPAPAVSGPDVVTEDGELEIQREVNTQRANILAKPDKSATPYAEELTYPKNWREAPRQSQSGLMAGDALVTERPLHTFGTRLSGDSEENGKRVKRVAQRLPVELLNVTADEVWIIAKPETQVVAPGEDSPGSGVMLAKLAEEEKEIPLPLKHTDVQGQISGYIATVEVTQQFHNPYDEKIEAVYVFPLPQNAAINEFIMTIGERRIRGIIRERKEAERIYRQA
ncbi:MAG: VIT domain-containing protein, partial [Planctomycetota bacterium]